MKVVHRYSHHFLYYYIAKCNGVIHDMTEICRWEILFLSYSMVHERVVNFDVLLNSLD